MKARDVERREPTLEDDWPADGLEWLGRCPVCGCEDRAGLYSGLQDRVFFCAPGRWALYQCSACQSAYLDPRPTPDTISLAYSSYFTHHPTERAVPEGMRPARRWQRALANGYRNWRYGTRELPANRLGIPLAYMRPNVRAMLDATFRHLPKARTGSRLLDIGCGDGTFLHWAALAGWNATGVDPDPAAVVVARARGLNVSCGTAESLQVKPSSFDVVTLSHVIEHVHDPRALLERVRVLLKPGGLLWLDTPNLSALGHRRFRSSWFGLDPPRHLVIFNHCTLGGLLRSVGFRVLRQYSRFEICRGSFASSEAIARSSRNPLRVERLRLPLRLRASLASWRVRTDPELSEWITVMAAKQP